MSQCNICTEKFNKTTRNSICCEYCHFEACTTCCRKWILNESAPRCMNNDCNRTWTRKFISVHFPKSFINRELKEHRENVLLQQEISLLPETQPYVEEILFNENIKKEIFELRQKQYKIEQKITALNSTRYRGRNTNERREFIRKCSDENCRGFLSSAWKCGICEKWTCSTCHVLKGVNRDDDHVCDPENVATAQLIQNETKPCPKCGTNIFKIDGCFAKNTQILTFNRSVKMSQDIEIGDILVGDDGKERKVLSVCSGVDDLFEVHQDKGLDYVVNSKHTLVLLRNYQVIEMMVEEYVELSFEEKEEIQGIKIINGKIIKTSIDVEYIGKGAYYGWEVDFNHRFLLCDYTVVRNCNQMWCTQCHTGFNWRTGRIETNVHNPHFFEWQRRNTENGVTQNQVPGNACETEVNNEVSRNIFNMINRNSMYENYETKQIYKTKISNIIRRLIHIREIVLPTYRMNYNENNRYLRIQYMRNQISENEFKILIQRNNKKYEKNTEIRNVLELLINTVGDVILKIYHYLMGQRSTVTTRSLLTTRSNTSTMAVNNVDFEVIDNILLEIDPIILYVNECFREISKTYSSKVIVYDNELQSL